jgi:NitT/TauT family transport system ATP-binding protein
MSGAASALLAIDGVDKRFPGGTLALSGIHLGLNARDFLVLLGPSGCGKSTLLRLIAGLEQPSSGRIRWIGDEPHSGEIGFVFQDPTLMPWTTALQNVSLPLRLRGAPDAAGRAASMLARVGLQEFLHARPSMLSGGMRMRVAIARALVASPKILLMDEPFAALDEFTRHRLQDELHALTDALGCTTVFVTHSLYEAAYLGSRIVLMSPRPGRISAEFPGAQVHDRLDPDYLARVADLTRALRQTADMASL